MSLGPDSYEEAKEAWKKQDEWRRESAKRYEDKRREECDSKYRSLGSNSKRRRDEFKRAYGGGSRVRWIQRQPCVACGEKPSENAHVAPPAESGGMGRKANAKWVVPLCAHCHSVYHSAGRTSFENGNGLDLTEEARKTDERWQDEREAA